MLLGKTLEANAKPQYHEDYFQPLKITIRLICWP